MKLKTIVEEDFVNYKIPSMFIGFPSCTFKCEQECGERVCQNSALAQSPDIEVSPSIIVQHYLDNPITKALVCGGLEPFDSFNDLLELVRALRKYSNDQVVIYTGYNRSELTWQIKKLQEFSNIIIKFGRFIPNQTSHFDDVLGVELASPNQYAERIS